jgi:hypothetical protein
VRGFQEEREAATGPDVRAAPRPDEPRRARAGKRAQLGTSWREMSSASRRISAIQCQHDSRDTVAVNPGRNNDVER